MNKQKLKAELSGYTKEEIIEGVCNISHTEPFVSLLLIEIRKASELMKIRSIRKLEMKASEEFKAYVAAMAALNDFLFGVAERHGILKTDKEGDKTFDNQEWHDAATKSERDEAMRLNEKKRRALVRFRTAEKNAEMAKNKGGMR